MRTPTLRSRAGASWRGGRSRPQQAIDVHGLGDDFSGGELALEAELAGRAKDAAHGAAGLAAHARRSPGP